MLPDRGSFVCVRFFTGELHQPGAAQIQAASVGLKGELRHVGTTEIAIDAVLRLLHC